MVRATCSRRWKKDCQGACRWRPGRGCVRRHDCGDSENRTECARRKGCEWRAWRPTCTERCYPVRPSKTQTTVPRAPEVPIDIDDEAPDDPCAPPPAKQPVRPPSGRVRRGTSSAARQRPRPAEPPAPVYAPPRPCRTFAARERCRLCDDQCEWTGSGCKERPLLGPGATIGYAGQQQDWRTVLPSVTVRQLRDMEALRDAEGTAATGSPPPLASVWPPSGGHRRHRSRLLVPARVAAARRLPAAVQILQRSGAPGSGPEPPRGEGLTRGEGGMGKSHPPLPPDGSMNFWRGGCCRSRCPGTTRRTTTACSSLRTRRWTATTCCAYRAMPEAVIPGTGSCWSCWCPPSPPSGDP